MLYYVYNVADMANREFIQSFIDWDDAVNFIGKHPIKKNGVIVKLTIVETYEGPVNGRSN